MSPLKVMFDTGVYTNSSVLEYVNASQRDVYGPSFMDVQVLALRRIAPQSNPAQQREIDCLFTVGRLLRERRIINHIYSEIENELARGPATWWEHSVLRGAERLTVMPAIDRSFFQGGLDFKQWISKGGKKDRDAGRETGGPNQLSFLNFLNNLSADHLASMHEIARVVLLPEQQKRNIDDLPRFQNWCRAGGIENFVDIFHVWTAERNAIDVFVTLDRRLANLFSGISKSRDRSLKSSAKVLMPSALISQLGVSDADSIPFEFGKLYPFGWS